MRTRLQVTKPRQLHNTHWKLLCPIATPEGHAVGLLKHRCAHSIDSQGRDARDATCCTGELLATSESTELCHTLARPRGQISPWIWISHSVPITMLRGLRAFGVFKKVMR